MTEEKWMTTLSTTERNNIGLIQVRQSNINSETWLVLITQNNLPLNFLEEGITQVFFCTKFGKNPVEQRATIIDAKKGHIKYTMNERDTQKVGLRLAYFKFEDDKGNFRGATQTFAYHVIPSIEASCSDGGTYIVRLEELFELYQDYYNLQRQDVINYQTDQILLWEKFFNEYREIIEKADPDGIALREMVEAHFSKMLNVKFDSVADRGEWWDSGLISKENATHPVDLTTPYFDDQATHPKVLYFPNKWKGYKYWMAYTPLTFYKEELENPCIAVSADGIKWEPPKGIKDGGLLDVPGINDYNSDTHLVFREDLNRLECWYRGVHEGNKTEIIYRKTSLDGINWSEREIVNSSKNGNVLNLLSPAVIFEDGIYKIWVIDNFKLVYYESQTGTDWNYIKTLDLFFGESQRAWHLDVEKTDLGYEMLIATKKGNNSTKDSLYHFVFKDMNQDSADGVKVLKPSTIGTWDDDAIYRSCFLKLNNKYLVWYGGVSQNKQYHIGLTISSTNNINSLKGTHSTFGQRKLDELIFSDGENVSRMKVIDKNPVISSGNGWKEIKFRQKVGGKTHNGIFGVRVNKKTGVMTRLGDAETSNFDNAFPWGGMRRCTVQDIGISDLGKKVNVKVRSYLGDSNYRVDGSSGQVMVEIPCFYYRTNDYPTLDSYELYISPEPLSGFNRHPFFFDKYGNPTDFKYVSAYEGSIYDVSASKYLKNDEQVADFDNDKLCSVSGSKPVSGTSQKLSIINARKLANNQKFDLLSINALSAIQMLYLVEYASLDSQSAVGTGVVNVVDDGATNKAVLTGATDDLGSQTGFKSNGSFSYRGIENLWGNIWTFVDGINIASGNYYVNLLNGDNTSDKSTSPYLNTDIKTLTENGFINNIALNRFIDYLFLPSSLSYDANYKDYYIQDNSTAGYHIMKVGGAWDSNNLAGLFAISIADVSGNNDRKTNARICI